MKVTRIQVNEDDRSFRRSLVERLSAQGFECLEAGDGREGLRVFVRERPDLVITDLQMDPVDGIEFLRRAKEARPEAPIIVMSAHGSEENLLNSLRLGARDFLRKPFSFAALTSAIHGAMTQDVPATAAIEEVARNLVGESPQVAALQGTIEKLARAGRSTILILGESGTGKEVVAHQLHRLSRCSGRFIPLNCALSDGGARRKLSVRPRTRRIYRCEDPRKGAHRTR